MKIDNIYEQLKATNLCQSGYDFSVNYLGKTKSYYSVLKARQQTPSLEALVNLDYVLRQQIEWLDEGYDERMQATVMTLATLQLKVSEQIDEQCSTNVYGATPERL